MMMERLIRHLLAYAGFVTGVFITFAVSGFIVVLGYSIYHISCTIRNDKLCKLARVVTVIITVVFVCATIITGLVLIATVLMWIAA